MRRNTLLIALLAAASALLTGCDALGIETAAQAAEKKEAEGKAIGSACRHAMRAIEDCYVLNPKAQKAAVYTGWREMDEYMRENKIEGTPSVLTKAEKPEPRKGGSSSNTEIETETRDPAASRSRS